MKPFFATFFLACFLNIAFAQSVYDIRISNALNDNNWFELKRAYEAGSDSIAPMLKDFAECLLESNFNEPEKACTAIDNLLRCFSNEIGLGNIQSMLYLKTANQEKLGKYEEAAQTLEATIKAIEPYADANSLVPLKEKESQCRELSKFDVINQVVMPETDVRVPFRLDSVGREGKRAAAIMLEAEINNNPQGIMFDTGAGVNVVSDKAAERLGLVMLDVASRVQGFGLQQGKYAIAQEIKLGNATLRNVPFYVLTVKSGVDSIDALMNHLDVILGVEFMNAVKEVQIDFVNHELLIPQTPTIPSEKERQTLSGGCAARFNMEITEQGEPLLVALDTGAGSSVLAHKYYVLRKEHVEKNGKPDILRQAGAGGIKIEDACRLENFSFTINGMPVSFPFIFVSTTEDSLADSAYGNLGMDFFTQFGKVIFNTKDMFLRFSH